MDLPQRERECGHNDDLGQKVFGETKEEQAFFLPFESLGNNCGEIISHPRDVRPWSVGCTQIRIPGSSVHILIT